MVNYYVRRNLYFYDTSTAQWRAWHKKSRKIDFMVESVIHIPNNYSKQRRERLIQRQIVEMDAMLRVEICKIGYDFVFDKMNIDEGNSAFFMEETTEKPKTQRTLFGDRQNYTFRAVDLNKNKEFKNYEI
jgi:hypothetical protein